MLGSTLQPFTQLAHQRSVADFQPSSSSGTMHNPEDAMAATGALASFSFSRVMQNIGGDRPWQRLGDLLRATCARSTPHCSGYYPACENGLGVPPLVRFTLTIPYQAQLAVGGTFCLPVVRIPGDPSHSYKQLGENLDLQARTV